MIRELMERIRDFSEKQSEAIKRMNLIVKTLRATNPTLRIQSPKKHYSGKLIKIRLENNLLEFTIENELILNGKIKKKRMAGKLQIPDELEDIVLWTDSNGKAIFWDNLIFFQEEGGGLS